jgi:nanoRNase/pAp phosphatase (c-di-AMP/oligoRNAs hydrolase)
MSTLVNEDLNKDAKSGRVKIGGKSLDTKRLESLRKVLTNREGDLNILVTQVDPDAVGSAVVASAIFELMGKKSKIHYCGNFGHPQNRAISNRFNLKSEMSQVPDDNKDEYLGALDNIVLVDSSLADDSRVGAVIDPIIVIDHHRGADLTDSDNTFMWIEDVGSAWRRIAKRRKTIFLRAISGWRSY